MIKRWIYANAIKWDARRGEWTKDTTSAETLEVTDVEIVSGWQPILAIPPAASSLPNDVFEPAPEASLVAFW